MKDEDKSKRQLIDELVLLRQQVAELKALESERKQAEDALRESEAKWRSLVENAPASITTLDREGTILFTNRPMRLDRTAKQVIGTSTYNYLPPHEQEKTRQILETVFKSGGAVRYETTIIKDRDTRVSYENRVAPIKHDDLVVAALHIAIDITERKRIEEALAESEGKLDNILSSINDLIFVFDKEGRFILYRSPATEELYLPPEKFLGKKPSAVMPPHMNKLFARAFAENKEGKVAEYEYSLEIGGGTNWYSVKLSPVYSKGEFGGSVAVARNITERKRMEEALRDFNEKYRSVIENTNIGILVIQDGQRVFYNSKMYEMFGYTEQEYCNTDFVSLVHPEDRPNAVDRIRQRLMGVAMGPDMTEMRALAKSGDIKWIKTNSVVIQWKGRPALQAFVTDITERKRAEEALRESEERYRTLFEGVPVGLYRTTPDGQILNANPALIEMLGHPDRETLLATNAGSGYVNAADRVRWQALMDREGAMRDFEVQWRRHDGTVIWVKESARTVRDVEGRVLYYEGAVEDITERKQAEKEMQDSVQKLQIAYQQAQIYAQELKQEIGERKQAQAEIEKLNAELEQRIADRTRELAALYDATAVASASLDLETMLEQLLKSILLAIRSNSGYIHLLAEAADTPDEKGLHLAVAQGLSVDQLDRLKNIALGQGLAGWVAGHDELLVVPDVTADPRTLEFTPEKKLGYTGAPIRVSGKVLGTLSVLNTETQSFSAEEVALLASVADQIGIIVESARLRQQAEQAAVLAERERLARDLHDAVTQSLYSLPLFAETGLKLVETSQVDGQLDGQLDLITQNLTRIRDVALQALKEMRLLIHELTPLDLSRGLAEALHRRLHAVEERAKIKTKLIVADPVELPLSIEEGLYRIAQEALNNALKHANATEVSVCLNTTDGQVELEIFDNGSGFDSDTVNGAGGMGLANMRERAERLGGLLSIDSNPAEGTRIKVSVKVYENP